MAVKRALGTIILLVLIVGGYLYFYSTHQLALGILAPFASTALNYETVMKDLESTVGPTVGSDLAVWPVALPETGWFDRV